MDYVAIITGAAIGALVSLLPSVGKASRKIVDSIKRAAVHDAGQRAKI
jgi:hypothetical protein